MQALTMKKNIVAALIAICCWSSKGEAEVDFPGSHLFFSVKGDRMVEVLCDKVDPVMITCSFFQVTVSKVSSDVWKSLLSQYLSSSTEAGQQFFAPDECEKTTDKYNVFKEGKPSANIATTDRDEFLHKSDDEKSNILNEMAAFIAVCEQPSEESLTKWAKLRDQREQRTCNVTSHEYKEAFKLTAGDIWTSNKSDAADKCGTVQIDTFQKETGPITNWTYKIRRIVTNKNAEWSPGMKCNAIDETEDVFEDNSEERFVKCDYIKFGRF
jgi:hypothetical protein